MSRYIMVDLEHFNTSVHRFGRDLDKFERGLRALATYYPTKPAPRSRNKREGRYLDRIGRKK